MSTCWCGGNADECAEREAHTTPYGRAASSRIATEIVAGHSFGACVRCERRTSLYDGVCRRCVLVAQRDALLASGSQPSRYLLAEIEKHGGEPAPTTPRPAQTERNQ
jgi:hypothetical protein